MTQALTLKYHEARLPVDTLPSQDAGDSALIRRVIAHDREAFATLYNRYASRLRKFLRKRLAQAELVDEVLNDVMWTLWQTAKRYPQDVPLAAWLYGIAKNKVRQCCSRTTLPTTTWPVRGDETAPIATGPEDVVEQQDQERRLTRALARMTPTERIAVEMLVYHGCSYQEIATRTETPLNTVKVQLFRARRRLAKYVGEE